MDKTIALYMRLSDEDDNLAAHEESNSGFEVSRDFYRKANEQMLGEEASA